MIEIKDLTKNYVSKSKETVTALDGISLTLPSKGLVFLLGESGAGKSTLLNIIGGVERADSGEITVDGLDIKKWTNSQLDIYRNSDVGFIFQDFNLLDNFNVIDNVNLAQDLQRKKQSGKAEKALAAVNMSGYEKRKINELSGGQKQRIAIARAIIKDPKIILADEPTGALDAKTGKTILELLKDISKDSLVLVVSHDEAFANQFADRIIRIADGAIVEDIELNNSIENVDFKKEDKIIDATQKKSYSLSAKTVAKMSAYSLGSKKIRLAITLILCIVCFAVFGIADTLAAWNCEQTVYDAILSTSDKYLINRTHSEDLLNDNYEKLYSFYDNGVNIKELYLPKKEELSYSFYTGYGDGFIEIDDKKAEELGVELYAGRFPEKQGEIAISYHTYRGFKAGAYKTDDIYIDGSMIEPTDKENGIFGKTITLDRYFAFTIVGIIDSGYDYEKNSHLDPLSKNYSGINNEIRQLEGHSLLFLPKGGIEYINSLMQTSDYPYGVPSYSQYSFDKAILNEFAGSRVLFVSDLETFQKSGTRILWFGEEKVSLADNEIIISYKDIDDLLGNMTYIPGISNSLEQSISLTYVKIVSDKLSLVTEKFNKIDYKFFRAYANAEIYKYAIQNAELYQDDDNIAKIIENYTDGNVDISLAVAYYISTKGISSEIQTGYLQNPYGKSGLEIVAETNIALLNQYNIANQFNGAIVKLGDGSELNVKIAGVYIPSEATGVIMQESYGSYFITE
ncbi:MAG: ABC transporter ATP-binding protein, partial [Turicibacter sp.]|nr:ABC transporter ATP-binding protein [Turicibacter sp.]